MTYFTAIEKKQTYVCENSAIQWAVYACSQCHYLHINDHYFQMCSLKTARPIKAKFHVEPPKNDVKIYILVQVM